MEKEKPEEEQQYVTQAELSEFANVVKDRLCDLEKTIEAVRSESRKPKVVKTDFYRCTEEGCEFVTDDLVAFVEHTVEEKLKKLSLTEPEETVSEQTETRPRIHGTFADFLDCPECYPKFEKLLLEKGWKKPEPKRGGLF